MGVCVCVCVCVCVFVNVFVHLQSHHLFTNEAPPLPSPLTFSPDETSRARALLASVAQLQPLIFGLSEEVLASSLELSPTRLQQALDRLAYQVATRACMHAHTRAHTHTHTHTRVRTT